jgi:hypothetical protein
MSSVDRAKGWRSRMAMFIATLAAARPDCRKRRLHRPATEHAGRSRVLALAGRRWDWWQDSKGKPGVNFRSALPTQAHRQVEQ